MKKFLAMLLAGTMALTAAFGVTAIAEETEEEMVQLTYAPGSGQYDLKFSLAISESNFQAQAWMKWADAISKATDGAVTFTFYYDDTMKQVAESDVTKSYGDHLRDEAFANAEVFGIDRDGDQGTAYAYLYDGEYVVLKDKAYEMSDSAGEVMIKFIYGKDDVTLSEVIWSADGEEHEKWMKENFPAEYLKKSKNYKAYDANGRSVLGSKLRKTVEEALGVPVESENLLMIDTDKGTYEIIKTIDGDDGTFDTETLETGNLKEL